MKTLLLILTAASLTAGCNSSKKTRTAKQSFRDTAQISWKREAVVNHNVATTTATNETATAKDIDSAYKRTTITRIWYKFDSSAKKVVPIARHTEVEETGKLQRNERTADSTATASNTATTDSSGRASMDSSGGSSYSNESMNQINKTKVFSLWWLVFAGGMFFFVVQKIKLPFPRGTI